MQRKYIEHEPTRMAYINLRKKTLPYKEINENAGKTYHSLKRAIEQYCEKRNEMGMKNNHIARFNMASIDFDFIVDHWPYEKMLTVQTRGDAS